MEKLYSLQTPGKVISGAGAIDRLCAELKAAGTEFVGLFVDKGVGANQLVKELVASLKAELRSVTVVDCVPPEPEEGDVKRAFAELEGAECDAIVAIGGGSVMDTAKFVSVMLKNPEFRDDLTDKEAIQTRGVPLYAVPTSAGTGSEATPNAIVLLPEKKLKVGVVHDFFLPECVILDARLTVSMPRSVTASTGIDAFCHCIETLISKKSNPFAEIFALKGLRLITDNLRRAYRDGSDIEARSGMLLAALYGGVAISASSTVAVHALSYPLGGSYRIPHGVSNAVLLAPVMRYNVDAIGDKLPAIAEAMRITEGDPGEQVIKEITALVRDVGIPEKLTDLGITADDLEFLTVSASEVHRLLDQNPKAMSLEDIRSIYRSLL